MRPVAEVSPYSTLIGLDENENEGPCWSPSPHSVYDNLTFATCLRLLFTLYENDDKHEVAINDSDEVQYLHLPLHHGDGSDSAITIDKYLCSVPCIRESSNFFLSSEIHLFDGSSKFSGRGRKVLNIFQGEIATATSSQADVLISTKATTCHIVAVRSVSLGSKIGNEKSSPLSSLCHIDKAGYENCLREMILEHKAHHNCLNFLPGSSAKISMELHIMGGFDDVDNCSSTITAFLLNFFVKVSEEELGNVEMTLKTCAVSCLNDNGFSCPIGRGMGLDTRSGKVFLAATRTDIGKPLEPAFALRSSRTWCDSPNKLSIIHSSTSVCDLTIEPFKFAPFEQLDMMLQLPDEILLEYISTSPEIEEEDFCRDVRTILRFLKDNSWYDFFGPQCDVSIMYNRCKGQSIDKWIKI